MMSKGSKSKVKSLYSFTCTESVNSAFFSPTGISKENGGE